MSSKWWPLISHHVIKGSHLSLRHQGAPFLPSRHQGDPNFQNSAYTMRCVLIKMCHIWNHVIEINVCEVWVELYVGGVKGIRLWSMGRGPGESVVHGPRTSSLRHWSTGCRVSFVVINHSRLKPNHPFFFLFFLTVYILNYTERNFDQFLVTLKISHYLVNYRIFVQNAKNCVVSMVTFFL